MHCEGSAGALHTSVAACTLTKCSLWVSSCCLEPMAPPAAALAFASQLNCLSCQACSLLLPGAAEDAPARSLSSPETRLELHKGVGSKLIYASFQNCGLLQPWDHSCSLKLVSLHTSGQHNDFLLLLLGLLLGLSRHLQALRPVTQDQQCTLGDFVESQTPVRHSATGMKAQAGHREAVRQR